ncbi:MAG: hypothetical protein AAF556_05945 [Pseudomonadota bacterium]
MAWSPGDYADLEMADGFEQAQRHQIRWLAEHVSLHVNQQAIPPVTASIMMSVTLRSYADLYQRYDRFVAIFGAAQVAEVFAPGAVENFWRGDHQTATHVIEQAGAGTDIANMVAKAVEFRDYPRTSPQPPGTPHDWYVQFGDNDRDFAAGSLPLSEELGVPLPPPPPLIDSIDDRLDLAATYLATRLSDDHQQEVSVYWQGSMAF